MAFLDIDSEKKKDTDTAIDVRLEEASLSGGRVGYIRE